MDEDDEEFERSFEHDGARIPSIRARPVDYWTAFFIFLNDIAEALDTFTNMLVSITARHANYKSDQTRFADEVRAGLETIPEE